MTLQLVEKYQKKLRYANETRERMELLFLQKKLIERDILACTKGCSFELLSVLKI